MPRTHGLGTQKGGVVPTMCHVAGNDCVAKASLCNDATLPFLEMSDTCQFNRVDLANANMRECEILANANARPKMVNTNTNVRK